MQGELISLAIDKLRRGERLPREWVDLLSADSTIECVLSFRGKIREEEIIADTLAVPLQVAREFNCPPEFNGWRNRLIFGDNLQTLKTLRQMRIEGSLQSADGSSGVRLVYIDPPFATRQDFKGRQAQDAYQDRVAGSEFVESLRKRLVLIREILASDATVYVHLDTRKVHYIRVVLDEIFGPAAFKNEVIWKRTNARSNKELWPRVHDSLLIYQKGRGAQFSPQYAKADKRKLPHTLITGADGKKYQTYELTGPGRTQAGPSGKPWRGFDPGQYGRHWATDPKKLDELDSRGLIHWPVRNGFPRRRDEKPFDEDDRRVLVGDVWTDVDRINQAAGERENYPTQKPEGLLERIIESSSAAGDLILDAYAGSGTTAIVAERLGRRWIAIDSSRYAIYTMQRRLLALGKPPKRGKIDKTRLPARPFSLLNAGLYDFKSLSTLPWREWRFFALKLFGCEDSPHLIKDMAFDGYFRGSSVLVFNHTLDEDARISVDTLNSIYRIVGERGGSRFFIVAPKGVFDFYEDYIDIESVRFYALRIPYSVIPELHRHDFELLQQPTSADAVNEPVEAVGFDFEATPDLRIRVATAPNSLGVQVGIQIDDFQSRAQLKSTPRGLAGLSMVLVDYDCGDELLDIDAAFFRHDLERMGWFVPLDTSRVGSQLMMIFIDIAGNERRVLLPGKQLSEEGALG